jgi:hypothetical protein
MRTNEILSFASKWMELENIILSEVSQANLIYPLSYVDLTVMWLNLGHMIRGEHIQEVRNPKHDSI